ncbi:hypothetical protein ACIBVK_30060 [Micromonospora echinofusca]|uniref:hypothetical protein n=1 Tax=Micromonospora echinofusca TaxID=47858 RepID=UPI0037903A18
MTALGEKIEQRLSGRPDSHVPAQPRGEPRALNLAMHHGEGAVLGVVRAVNVRPGQCGHRVLCQALPALPCGDCVRGLGGRHGGVAHLDLLAALEHLLCQLTDTFSACGVRGRQSTEHGEAITGG